MNPEDVNDLKQEIHLGQITKIWSKLEPEVQECLVILAQKSLFKNLSPSPHDEDNGENTMLEN